MRMFEKNPYPLFLIFSILFLSCTFAYGQTEVDINEMSNLLEDESKNDFLKSTKSGKLNENFGNRAKVTEHGNDIWIMPGHRITIDDSATSEFGTILIDGTLEIFETGDNPLRTQKIIVGPSGKLTIGINETPIDKNKKAEIVFIKNQPGEIGIFVFGELTLHGYDIGPSFVELTSDAKPGQEVLAVAEPVKNWKRNSKILITSPGNHPDFENCTEENKINRIDGVFIYLKEPLDCFHPGFNNDDELVRSHIAVLDRNIVIKSDDPKNRGSVNFFYGSQGAVKYAEFRDLGPKNVLARYPIHFHHMQDTSRGIEVEGNSIVNSDNRWITIHDSNGILIKNNVGYNSIGHGFFLEAGTEFDNIFDGNLGVKTRPGNLIHSDKFTSVFWTMNPQNAYVNNVASDGWYYGFYYSIPNMMVPIPNKNDEQNLKDFSNLEFENNIAYNNRHAGLKIDRVSFSQESDYVLPITISGLRIWNQFINNFDQWGIEVNANHVIIKNAQIFDSPIGIEMKRKSNVVENSIIKIISPSDNHQLISGILISGQNQTIKDSLVGGYISNQISTPSDITISNSYLHKEPLSGTLFNTKLLDPNPIYFGNPVNPQSFLRVYGYDAPNVPNKSYPSNFILKTFDNNILDESEKIVDMNFFATIEPLNDYGNLNVVNPANNLQNNVEKSENELTQMFKSRTAGWEKGLISDNSYVENVKILIDYGLIDITFTDPEYLDDNDFEIPSWMKQTANFWIRDLITAEEFLNSLAFVLESGVDNSYSEYG